VSHKGVFYTSWTLEIDGTASRRTGPRFRLDKSALEEREAKFLLHGGLLLGALLHIRDDDKTALTA
jgi:hypothetical protein